MATTLVGWKSLDHFQDSPETAVSGPISASTGGLLASPAPSAGSPQSQVSVSQASLLAGPTDSLSYDHSVVLLETADSLGVSGDDGFSGEKQDPPSAGSAAPDGIGDSEFATMEGPVEAPSRLAPRTSTAAPDTIQTSTARE